MITGKFIWKPLLQKAITGQSGRFRMIQREPGWPTRLSRPGLYLHVPFCKNLCPYCPYNRIEYEENLFSLYERAVMQEIDLYAPYLMGSRFESLYIGGGTPTVNTPGLLRILDHLRQSLAFDGDICIELHPANMEKDCLSLLKDTGVTMLSIGTESSSTATLKEIGRNHDGQTAINAVQRALKLNFKSVNVDLMFALPNQTMDNWKTEVKTMVELGVDQLSTYPLFTFPYTELGETENVRLIKRPKHRIVKAMLDFTDEYCEKNGLHRCAVWSWLRPTKAKFSSITRHHYIGFGPSAASMTRTDFLVNTFDVKAYARALPYRRPIALSMPLDIRIEMAYWLYWRIYELKIENQTFRELFGPDMSLDKRFGYLFRPLITMGMMERSNDSYHVTKSGAYWIHRLQNEYSLNYINRLWGTCRKVPWPEEVRL